MVLIFLGIPITLGRDLTIEDVLQLARDQNPQIKTLSCGNNNLKKLSLNNLLKLTSLN